MRFWCDRTGHGAGCVRLFCPVRGAVRALLSGEKGRGFVRVEALARGGCGPLAALFVLPCTNRRNTVGGTQNGNGRKEKRDRCRHQSLKRINTSFCATGTLYTCFSHFVNNFFNEFVVGTQNSIVSKIILV